jgi:hypothetical protein
MDWRQEPGAGLGRCGLKQIATTGQLSSHRVASPMGYPTIKSAWTGSTGVPVLRSRSGDRWWTGGRCRRPTRCAVALGMPEPGPPERHRTTARRTSRCGRTCSPTTAPCTVLSLPRARAATGRSFDGPRPLPFQVRKRIVSRRSLRLAERRRSCRPDVARRSSHATRLCGTAR